MADGGQSTTSFKPFVSEETQLPELTFKAVLLGVLMALVLGSANAYLGMKAGLTVAATFPAAVVAMAAMRLPFLRGSILEENIARTTASVGEALVAGAIFTIPAFVISGVWDELRYWESTAIMLIGGLLGVLFIIVLRRTLVVEAALPFRRAWQQASSSRRGRVGSRPVRRMSLRRWGSPAPGNWSRTRTASSWLRTRPRRSCHLAGRRSRSSASKLVTWEGFSSSRLPRPPVGRCRVHRRATDRRDAVCRGRVWMAALGTAEPVSQPPAGSAGDRPGGPYRSEHGGVAATGSAARRWHHDRGGVLHAVQASDIAGSGDQPGVRRPASREDRWRPDQASQHRPRL